jgi:hypothetical protein
MRRLLPAILVVVFVVGFADRRVVAGQASGGLVGAWQLTEAIITGPSARTLKFPEPHASLMIFTPRHYSRVEVQSEGPRPLVPNAATATADQLRATWGPFVGEAGTYEVAGDSVTMHPIASKNPAVMGPTVFIKYKFSISGNTLTLTQDSNQNGPFEHPFTIKAVRVE